jgi:hypothetical protein
MLRSRFLSLGFALLLAGAARADVPREVGYQGVILDASGQPFDGSANLAISLWRHATSTATSDRLYREVHGGAAIVDGVYAIALGRGAQPLGTFSAELFGAADLWLELAVDGETLTPRQKLQTVPYAFRSADAERVGGRTAAELDQSAAIAALLARSESAECRLDALERRVRCEQPAEPGPCAAMLTRWAFDASLGACAQFVYGGCGGNDNNFETLAACESRCEDRPVCQ